MKKELLTRSRGNCELCGAEGSEIYVVAPKQGTKSSECIYTCSTCDDQLTGTMELLPNHWRSLSDSMWSEVDAVKVVAYRTLHALKTEDWANDLLEMIYMEDDALLWAKDGIQDGSTPKHVDSNGVEIFGGDSVVLIKDLKVKGGGFTAKRGTAVRNVRLVHDNPEQIEGKVDGQTIVILTQYVKK